MTKPASTSAELMRELEETANYLRTQGLDTAASWLDRASDHIEFLETEMKIASIDAVDYDDRKELREVFQDAAGGRLTIDGPAAAEYDGVIAVARWGAQQAFERMTEARPPAPEPCAEETWSWDHFRDTQVDPYWIRCTEYGEHAEHRDSNTGLSWKTTA